MFAFYHVQAKPDASEVSNTIIFDCSKKELFSPNNGFKSWTRKLKVKWKVVVYVLIFCYSHFRTMNKKLQIVQSPPDNLNINFCGNS